MKIELNWAKKINTWRLEENKTLPKNKSKQNIIIEMRVVNTFL